ncbi:iron-containing alcohol dehydrogenase [Roseovarius sp. Pro17]|uniref:iron-containing alcohol dehydrogenase n=1 Tax=Roseovarius sp. Pro17 TaxID=3108175 RepID=UPI002D79485E|nr:iron-containing alcohol dehydrogenase [Roseovarius sp. Pro17]
MSTLMAVEGLRAFHAALPTVCETPSDLETRGKTLYGAWLCGTVLGQVGMSLHHKLCHVLGGAFDLPHAQTHAVMLPHTIAFNVSAAGSLLDPLREIFGNTNVGQALAAFADTVGAPRASDTMPEGGRPLYHQRQAACGAAPTCPQHVTTLVRPR